MSSPNQEWSLPNFCGDLLRHMRRMGAVMTTNEKMKNATKRKITLHLATEWNFCLVTIFIVFHQYIWKFTKKFAPKK